MREPGAKRPTRHDVAVLAGVSDAVVTYTLNGDAPVAPATAARVHAAIRTLGYRPNQSARALKLGSAKTLALIVPHGEEPLFANPFFAAMAIAIEAQAQRRGYALHMAPVASQPESMLERMVDFASRQVDGVILVPGPHQLEPSALDALGMPWLQLDTTAARPGVESMGTDLFQGAFDACEHLISHGYTQIGFMGSKDEHEPRQEGWRAACQQYGLVPGPVFHGPYTRGGSYALGREMLAGGQAPQALFAASDSMALGFMRACHEAGVRVPEDLALVSFDGSWESEYSWPALTSVRQPIEAMAELAVDRILAAPSATERRHTLFLGELVVRASCGWHPTPKA